MSSSGRTKQQKRAKLFKQQRGRCVLCGGQMCLSQGKPHSATFEHLRPKSDCGDSTYLNQALSCFGCNQARGRVSVDVAKIKPISVQIGGRAVVVIAMSAQFCGDGS